MIVRYLTGDPPYMAERASQIIDGSVRLILTSLILAETAYVLSSVYAVERPQLVDALLALIAKQNIELWHMDEASVTEALLLCRGSHRVSFADALLWVTARASEAPVVYTFDRRFPAQDIDLRR